MKRWGASLLRNPVGPAKQSGQPLTFFKLEKRLRGDRDEDRKVVRGLCESSR